MSATPELRFQHPLFAALIRPLAVGLAWVLFTVLGPTRSFGRRNVPRQGGLLILSNHRSDVDPALLQITCPRIVHFMAKSELFEMRFLGRFLRAWGAFPVKRGEPDRAAIKLAVAYLQAGAAVCIFPEGELSENGEMLPLKPGVALVVRMANVPVVCVGLKGTARLMPYGKLVPRPAWGWITARWGRARRFAAEDTAETILAWVDQELRNLSQ